MARQLERGLLSHFKSLRVTRNYLSSQTNDQGVEGRWFLSKHMSCLAIKNLCSFAIVGAGYRYKLLFSVAKTLMCVMDPFSGVNMFLP